MHVRAHGPCTRRRNVLCDTAAEAGIDIPNERGNSTGKVVLARTWRRGRRSTLSGEGKRRMHASQVFEVDEAGEMECATEVERRSE
eukprot:1233249-Pleurochrysis_carterae.AAC.2